MVAGSRIPAVGGREQVISGSRSAVGGESADDAKPNILLIMTDDQRFGAPGVVQEEQDEKARFH